MKLILNLLTLITFISAAELEIGSTMPKMDHALKDISGRAMTLSDVKGNAGTWWYFPVIPVPGWFAGKTGMCPLQMSTFPGESG